jgi:hypothetical protein
MALHLMDKASGKREARIVLTASGFSARNLKRF